MNYQTLSMKGPHLLGDVRPGSQSRRHIGDVVWVDIWRNTIQIQNRPSILVNSRTYASMHPNEGHLHLRRLDHLRTLQASGEHIRSLLLGCRLMRNNENVVLSKRKAHTQQDRGVGRSTLRLHCDSLRCCRLVGVRNGGSLGTGRCQDSRSG